MLTQKKVTYLFKYNLKTGLFTWRNPPVAKSKIGDAVGYPGSKGHLGVILGGKGYYLHRLAFLYVEGFTPENQIDHINGNVIDNSWSNLREASARCNNQNQKLRYDNKSGFRGVSWAKKRHRWHAQMQVNNVVLDLGYYETAIEAALTRITCEEYCPDWSCNGNGNHREKVLRAAGII